MIGEKTMDEPKQIGWTNWKFDIQFSKNPASLYKRFYVTRSTSGYTVVDTTTGDLARLDTLAAAHAWAGIRVGERCVRH
jgi:hypothetical protein